MLQVPNEQLFKNKKAWDFNFIRVRGLRLPLQQISKPTPLNGREHRHLLLLRLKLSKFRTQE